MRSEIWSSHFEYNRSRGTFPRIPSEVVMKAQNFSNRFLYFVVLFNGIVAMTAKSRLWSMFIPSLFPFSTSFPYVSHIISSFFSSNLYLLNAVHYRRNNRHSPISSSISRLAQSLSLLFWNPVFFQIFNPVFAIYLWVIGLLLRG